MKYTYIKGHLTCDRCKTIIQEMPANDRHACYWNDLEKSPIGFLVLSFRGQYDSYNDFEKRIAYGIWLRVKERDKPKNLKMLEFINETNISAYNTWVKAGDLFFSERL